MLRKSMCKCCPISIYTINNVENDCLMTYKLVELAYYTYSNFNADIQWICIYVMSVCAILLSLPCWMREAERGIAEKKW